MLQKCQKYALAINARGAISDRTFDHDLLLEQYKMINWLQKKIPLPKQRFFKCS
jgi:hypothetical protein